MSTAERRSWAQGRREAAIRAVAASQLALFTHDQALDAGFTPPAIGRRVSSAIWERLLPGVYRLAGAPTSGRQVALAACLWAGPEAVVSHESAAVLWAFDGIITRRIHVTVPRTRRVRSPIVAVHGSSLPEPDRTRLDVVPITTPARTLIDCAPSLDDENLEAALEDALKRTLFTERFLRWRLQELSVRGRTGIARLRRILDDRRNEAALEGRLEVKVWRLLRRSGLPRAVRQHWVTADGRRYRLDFAWPDWQVAVEADGRIVHGGRRRTFYDDRRRLADLVSTDWRVVPVTWEDVEQRPTEWLTKLAQTLALAA